MLYWFIYGLFEIAITHEYISALQQHCWLCTLLLLALLYHHPVILIIIML